MVFDKYEEQFTALRHGDFKFSSGKGGIALFAAESELKTGLQLFYLNKNGTPK